MNELEKAAGLSEPAAPAPEVAESVNECVVKECAETESPAESISEVADLRQSEEKMQVETSEQEASASVASQEDRQDDSDVVDSIDEDKEEFRRIHAMTKQELCEALKQILDNSDMEAHREVALMKQAFFNLNTRDVNEQLQKYIEEGNDPSGFSAQPDEHENEFKLLFADFKARRAAYLAADEARRAENLEKKKEIITSMEEIAGDIDNVNTKYPLFQQLQADFKEIKDVPASAETEIWKQFQGVVEHFYDNLKINKELRDFDFKKNLEAKRALIEEAKALEKINDPVASFRALQGLHDKWRALGPVAKEIRDEIWNEFKEASTVINKRHQDYFEQRKAQEQANEEAKTRLCVEIESISYDGLKTFAEWNALTDKIIDLQKQWRSYGFASRKANTALYARFRKACDDFFAAKTEYFNKAKEELNDNLARKTALCERAEALKGETDNKKATDEIVKLQAEWKTIGSVPRKLSDAIWQRFTTACNYFFDERKRQNKERHAQENENLEKKRSVIARLSELPKDGDRAEVMPRIKELQAEWQEIGFVPFKMKDKIFAEYRAICDELYDSYNKREARQRMSSYQNRVSELKGDGSKIGRERDRLVRICESRRNELKTIENNMGFFSIKSSAGNSMLRDMENKIKRIKEDIKELEQKIAMLDNPDDK